MFPKLEASAMTRIALLISLLVTALGCLLPAAPAQAQAARTFVSAAGSDSNICTNVATPCRHFAAAYALTAPEGEIDVLDPANYGALTINQGISVQGHGWASLSGVSGSASITINGGDKINISGVILDGGGVASSTGIQFNGSGGTLTVRDSVIRNFGTDGILFQPNSSGLSQLFVSNTLASDNGQSGIQIIPTGSGTTTGVLDHVQLENNNGDSGLHVETLTQTINMTISDSVSANNQYIGIFAASDVGTPVSLMVRNCTIANNAVGSNSHGGLQVYGTGATMLVTRSTITGNGLSWIKVGGGVLLSYADNNIDGNGDANPAPPTTPYK
jgi:hypothetical protein